MKIVALSGGADSVCLLLKTVEAGHSVEALHCNFHLRGAESDRDEEFCHSLCRKLGVRLRVKHFDTAAYASEHKVSIEMAARELRYAWFEAVRQELGVEDILVAHHQDDNIETMLFNLMRGTGISGLTGMKERNGHIVRPLLDMTRQEILDFLAERGQDYVTDSTNLETDAIRNKIRLQLLPLMEEIFPSVRKNLVKTMRYLQNVETVVNGGRSAELDLFTLLKPLGFTSRQIEAIAEGRWKMSKERVGDESPLGTLSVQTYQKGDGFKPSREPFVVTLDADKVKTPLVMRYVREGDRFKPFGMKGCSKLVSDFLTDLKIDASERHSQPVVCDAEGEIIWLVGHRVCHKAACTENTINILELRYSNI